jgi:hypothetical protein
MYKEVDDRSQLYMTVCGAPGFDLAAGVSEVSSLSSISTLNIVCSQLNNTSHRTTLPDYTSAVTWANQSRYHPTSSVLRLSIMFPTRFFDGMLSSDNTGG